MLWRRHKHISVAKQVTEMFLCSLRKKICEICVTWLSECPKIFQACQVGLGSRNSTREPEELKGTRQYEVDLICGRSNNKYFHLGLIPAQPWFFIRQGQEPREQGAQKEGRKPSREFGVCVNVRTGGEGRGWQCGFRRGRWGGSEGGEVILGTPMEAEQVEARVRGGSGEREVARERGCASEANGASSAAPVAPAQPSTSAAGKPATTASASQMSTWPPRRARPRLRRQCSARWRGGCQSYATSW